MTRADQSAWRDTLRAIDLLTLDPSGLGGITVRARAGPVRDAFLEALGRLKAPLFRIHPAMSREALFGGLDLTATLSSGRLVETAGCLTADITPMLCMAERCPPDRAAELAAWLDDTRGTLVMLDEAAEPGEIAPPTLQDRLAFVVSLDPVGRLEATPYAHQGVKDAHLKLKDVETPKSAPATLVSIAARLGIDSLRAPLLALRAARANAALEGRDRICDEDLETAARLVLAPRATVLPQQPDDPPGPGEQTSEPETQSQDTDTLRLPEEVLVEAIIPHLPPDLLEQGSSTQLRSARGSGQGSKRRSNRRGRPLPSRPGRLGNGARVDLVATLRTAAPWQSLRPKGRGQVTIYPSDIRLKRYEEKSDRLLIFVVDASGSAAMARLAEAKGAVEVLLAQAYANRDHVSLIAFRGDDADLLLPPTRSLVQTKRRLAALPGGGGTPLAAGLRHAGELAIHARGQGLSPTVALLTDGRANIALDGQANRTAAREDAAAMARWLRAEGIPALVLDTSARPERALNALSKDLGAHYLALPRADAVTMGKTLERAIHDGLDA